MSYIANWFLSITEYYVYIYCILFSLIYSTLRLLLPTCKVILSNMQWITSCKCHRITSSDGNTYPAWTYNLCVYVHECRHEPEVMKQLKSWSLSSTFLRRALQLFASTYTRPAAREHAGVVFYMSLFPKHIHRFWKQLSGFPKQSYFIFLCKCTQLSQCHLQKLLLLHQMALSLLSINQGDTNVLVCFCTSISNLLVYIRPYLS